MDNVVTVYHFAARTLRDGRPLTPRGGEEIYEGPLVLCDSGLHGSESPLDGLAYAPGPLKDLHVAQAELSGDLEYGGDKHIGRRRRCLTGYVPCGEVVKVWLHGVVLRAVRVHTAEACARADRAVEAKMLRALPDFASYAELYAAADAAAMTPLWAAEWATKAAEAAIRATEWTVTTTKFSMGAMVAAVVRAAASTAARVAPTAAARVVARAAKERTRQETDLRAALDALLRRQE